MNKSMIMTFLLISFISRGVNCVYNEQLAQELTYYSFASYCSQEKIEAWDVGIVSQLFPGMTHIKVIQTYLNATLEMNQAFIGYSTTNKAIIVAFRGSGSVLSWASNIDEKKQVFAGCNCSVHQGFYLNYLDFLQNGLLQTLSELRLRFPLAKLYITGHQLGGAIATLFVSDLHASFIPVNLFLTQGSPRVGDADFYKWFESKKNTMVSYRLTHKKDPIPHLPIQLQGFHHIDQEVYYTDDTNYQLCQSVFGEDPDCCMSQKYTILNYKQNLNYIGIDLTQVTKSCK